MTCPVCGKPLSEAYRPFCSRRCADVDLGRWLNESYRIPAGESDSSTEDPEDPSLPPPTTKAH